MALHDIDGPIVQLKLQGACGSCPSSMTTMTMGIKRRLMEKIPVSLGLDTYIIACTGISCRQLAAAQLGLYCDRSGWRCSSVIGQLCDMLLVTF